MAKVPQDVRANGRGSKYCYDGCGSLASSPMFLDAHYYYNKYQSPDLMMDAPEKSTSCHVCEKTFSSCSVLKQHLLVHSKAKPYTCQECGKSFGRKGVLKRHLVTHSNEKPYHCELCGKGFTQKGSVVKHMVVHTGEKPYQCHKCLGSFTEKSNLLKHLRIVHKDKERYKCSKCEKGFAFKSQLTEHTNDFHLTNDKSFDDFSLLHPTPTPPDMNSEQVWEDDDPCQITTIGIPFSYPSVPGNGDGSGISSADTFNGTVYHERSVFSSAGNETQRLDESVNISLNQELSIQNLPKRSSIFVPLILYTV